MKRRIFLYLILILLLPIVAQAALVVGTNCGLVESAPSVDPEGAGGVFTIDNYARCIKITPAENMTITEIGWWCNNATQEVNYEVGIYSHEAVNDVPNALVGSDKTNAKGTGAGWKVCAGLNIELTASTIYWIGIQCDNTTPATNIDWESAAVGQRYVSDSSEDTFPDPWTLTSGTDERTLAMYALYTTDGEPPAEKKARRRPIIIKGD